MRSDIYHDELLDTIETAMTLPRIALEMKRRFEALSVEERTKRVKDLEDEKERKRVEWFINQGKCPYCGTKLKRGKKDKNHIRKWWCIKCNINLSKE